MTLPGLCGGPVGKLNASGKKDGLHVLLDILRSNLLAYQEAVKVSKTHFLSNVIATNSRNPRTIHSVINPAGVLPLEGSTALCNQFLSYFIAKVGALRHNMPKLLVHSQPVPPVALIFNSFTPISLLQLKDTLVHLKLTSSLLDPLPARFIKEGFDVLGPILVLFINLSLDSGVVLSALKHAIVAHSLKNLILTLHYCRPFVQSEFFHFCPKFWKKS